MLSIALSIYFLLCLLLILSLFLAPQKTIHFFCISFPLLPLSQMGIERVPFVFDAFKMLVDYDASMTAEIVYKAAIQFLAVCVLTLWVVIIYRNKWGVVLRKPFLYFYVFVILMGISSFFGPRIADSLFLWFIGLWGPFALVLLLYRFTSHLGRNFFIKLIDYTILGFFILSFMAWFYTFQKSGGHFEKSRAGLAIYSQNFSFPILILWLPFVLKRIIEKDRSMPLWYSSMYLGGMFLFLAFSLSRGAFVFSVMVFGLSLVFFGDEKSRVNKFVFISVICIGIFLFSMTETFDEIYTLFFARFFGAEDAEGSLLEFGEITAQNDRFKLIDYGLYLWRKSPFLGWGLGSFRILNPWRYSSTHNLTVNLLSENGLIGTISFWSMTTIISVRYFVSSKSLRAPFFIGMLGFLGIAHTTGVKLVQCSIMFSGVTMLFLFMVYLLPEFPELDEQTRYSFFSLKKWKHRSRNYN